ncbi:MAG: tryptophan synthase subunit beta [Endozoicomonadaceae bacterium]|nr:tryptophan synthase subunit beta [Endozoicomonadaceae bacterium]MBE8233067.1 tryptophan synthase subunit beta [Endozoicomonadaceae bacterium]
MKSAEIKKYIWPDKQGHFGEFGGQFIAETLFPAINELQKAFSIYLKDSDFQRELDEDLAFYVGRPSPLYFAKNLTQYLGGAKVFFKREDLNHTGAHKINHAVGQALLAKRMGKTRIIAETGAGQHGVATATVATKLGLKCVIYMGENDMKRQAANVYRMKLLGAEVKVVTTGSKTLKDAVNAALRDWVSNLDDTFYLLGTVLGPAPYPEMVRTFQSVVGREAKRQSIELTGKLPNMLVACVGGGSNAIGLFYPFIEDAAVQLVGVEAAGKGIDTPEHACRLSAHGRVGVLHGNRTYIMSNHEGHILPSHSISAGLDYPGVGPEHAWLKEAGRVNYVNATDKEALHAFRLITLKEGIIPALETSHALAYVIKQAPLMKSSEIIIVNLSGRGDKDINTVAKIDGITLMEN